MLKIIHINTVASPHNSVGQLIHELAKYERVQGNKVYVAAGYGHSFDSDFVMESKMGYLCNVILARLRDNDGRCFKRPTRRLCNWILNIKPDIVHIHNTHGYYLNLPLLIDFLKRHNIKAVLTLHDWWMLTGHCASIPPNDINCHWSEGCHNCRAKLSNHYPASYFKGNPFKHRFDKQQLLLQLKPLAVICPTPLLKQYFDQTINNKIKSLYIPNGTDIANNSYSSKPDKPTLDSTINVLAVASYWTPNKNLQALISLSDVLPKDMSLIIVGHVNDKLPNNITHIDHITNHTQLAKLYLSADVVINPSFSEGFGMVPAEALTLGIPVIVTKHSGTDSLITDNDGFAINCNDTQLLIKKIRQATLLRPVSKFHLNDMLNAYHQVYQI